MSKFGVMVMGPAGAGKVRDQLKSLFHGTDGLDAFALIRLLEEYH